METRVADPTWAGQPTSHPPLPYCSFPHLCPPSWLHGDVSFRSVILNIFSPQPPARELPLFSSKLSGTFISHPLRPSTSPRLALSLITHRVTFLKGNCLSDNHFSSEVRTKATGR